MKRLINSLASLLIILGTLIALPAQSAERVTYYHVDGLGSPVAATDQNGNLLWQEVYKPYGSRTLNQDGGTNQKWYTGKLQDPDTGLSYYGARWYKSEWGQFMGVDPLGSHVDNPQSFNLYTYGNNNPYRYVDPDGSTPIDSLVVLAVPAGRAIGGDIAYAQGLITRDNMLTNVVSAGLAKDQGSNATALGMAAAVFFLPPGSGEAGMEGSAAAKEGTAVIGRVKDLNKLNKGEKSLLDRLPDQGGPKANWKQNSGVLRNEMSKGKPIRDASPGDTGGQFLNAERNLLRNKGWEFNSKTNHWHPPKQ